MKRAVLLITILSLILAAPARSFSQRSTLKYLRTVDARTSKDERGLVALDQALRELTNPFTVLCVAARRGDEDDGTLAFLHKKLGARTVTLFATRGEGDD